MRGLAPRRLIAFLIALFLIVLYLVFYLLFPRTRSPFFHHLQGSPFVSYVHLLLDHFWDLSYSPSRHLG